MICSARTQCWHTAFQGNSSAHCIFFEIRFVQVLPVPADRKALPEKAFLPLSINH